MNRITFETRTSIKGQPTHKTIIADGVVVGYAHRPAPGTGWAVCSLAGGCIKANILTADLAKAARSLVTEN